MPTTGLVRGRLVNLYVGTDPIGCATECSLSVNRENIDTTCKDSNFWKEHLQGDMDWSINISALVAFDESNESAEDVFAGLVTGTPVTIKFSTEVTGDTYWTGSATIDSFEMNAPDGDITSYSATLTGTGALTTATVA